MAESNEYHIYVHIDGGKETKSAVAGAGTGSTGTDNVSETSDDSVMDAVTNKLKKMVSFAAVKSTADKIVNYNISQVSLRTGASEYEQRLSFTYNTASQVVGAGAALEMGAAMGGPAGLAVAAIGLAVSGIHKIMDIAQKEETLRMQESLENVSIGMAMVRAGTSGRRSKDQ